MTVIVALLRGVNVGGRGKLPMADLRAVAEGCGIDEARTYIQSGNLVGVTTARGTEPLARKLETAIASACAVTPDVTIRTRAQLAEVIERNPFRRRGEPLEHLHVAFGIDDAPAVIGIDDLERYAPEEVESIGRDLHLFLPGGMGRSKLASDLSRKGSRGTARNWRTITTLLEMAGDLG